MQPNLRTDIAKINSDLANIARQTNPNDYTNNAIVTFVDDDCYTTFQDRWGTVADAKSIKLTIGIITEKLGQYLGYSPSYEEDLTYLNLAGVKTLQANGHDIASHSSLHPSLTAIDNAVWDGDLSRSKKFMSDNGFNDKVLVYPNGFGLVTNAKAIELKAITRKHFDYAIDSATTQNIIPVDNYEIQRLSIDNMSLANMKIAVDNAITNKAWLVCMSHCGLHWDKLGKTRQQDYSDLIDYIQSLNVPILTATEALKRVGSS